MKLILPWPPSTNHTWRKGKGRMFVSAKTKTFRLAVASIVLAQKAAWRLAGPLEVHVTLYPPDRRKRDEDNFAGKALFDALTLAGVWEDDSQIRRKVVEWGEVTKPGAVVVRIVERPDLASDASPGGRKVENGPSCLGRR